MCIRDSYSTVNHHNRNTVKNHRTESLQVTTTVTIIGTTTEAHRETKLIIGHRHREATIIAITDNHHHLLPIVADIVMMLMITMRMSQC